MVDNIMLVITVAVVYCLFIFLVYVTIYNIADYKSHIKMNKNENLPYDYVNFNTFLKEFNKYRKNPRMKYGDKSIFLKDENFNRIVHLHANIVEFDGKCMIFKPLSYFKYRRWIKKQCKNKNRIKGLWDN